VLSLLWATISTPPVYAKGRRNPQQVDITISEINPSLCQCISYTKHSKDTTLNSESEDEDTLTVNDDKAIPSDQPHPRKADVHHDFEIIINQCLDRLEKAAIFDPNAATNMPVHPSSLFPEIMEFEKQQNALEYCTTLLLAILDSEETELQEKALVFQANSCMGRSKTTSHDDLGVMDFEDTTQKSSSIVVRPLDVSLQDGMKYHES